MNLLRRTQSPLILGTQENSMVPINGNRFSVIKRDGRRFEDLTGTIQQTMIVLITRSVIVKPRDLIERKLSNGDKETYQVIDPQFYDDESGLTGQYQIVVKPLGATDTELALNTIYVFNGKGVLVNQSSAG